MTHKKIERIKKMKISTILKELEKDSDIFLHISKDKITEEMCRKAIEKDGYLIHKFPNEFLTDEFYEMALETTPYVIDELPKKYQTYERYFELSKDFGGVYNMMPEEFRTKEMKETSIDSNFYILNDILKEDISKLEKDYYIKHALKSNWKVLGMLRENLITKEHCEISVSSSYLSFQYVPKEFRNEDMILKSLDGIYENLVKQSLIGLMVEIKKSEYTEKIVEKIMKVSPYVIFNIPYKFHTEERILLAIKDGLGLEKIPNKFLNEEIYELAVKINSSEFINVPKEYQSKKIIEMALIDTEKNHKYVYENQLYIRNKENLKLALPKIIKQKPINIISYDKYITDELIVIILKDNLSNSIFIAKGNEVIVNNIKNIDKKTKIKKMSIKKILNKIKDNEKNKKEFINELKNINEEDIIF